VSNQVNTIRRLFGNGAVSDFAMDAREYKRGGNPKNPGQFSKGGGGASGSKAGPKKEPKPKAEKKPKESTAKFPESMTAKPSRRRANPEAKAAEPKAEAKWSGKTRSITELGGIYKSPAEKIKRIQHGERGYTEKSLNKAKTTTGTLKDVPKEEAKKAPAKKDVKTKRPSPPKSQTNYFANPEAGSHAAAKSPEAFRSEMKRLNAYASLTTSEFNNKLSEKLGVKVPKGASLQKAIERFSKTHSEADILKAAGAVANENTRIH
jgi:hypothetical protein